MSRVFFGAVFCAVLTGSAWGYEIQYDCPPGTKLVRDLKETSEFTAIADIPGFEQFEGAIRASGKLKIEVGDIEGDYGVVTINGSRELEIEINDSSMDPQHDEIGPATLRVTEMGDVAEIDMPKFEADAESMMRFGWWYHITKQLNMITGLPAGAVSPNDWWKNVSQINSPAGGELTVTTKSRVMGKSWNDGDCVWIHSESKLPLNLKFKMEEGQFKVTGNVSMTSVTCFNLDKGFPTEKKVYRTATLAVEARATEEGVGQDFKISMVISSKDESKTRPVEEDKEQKEEGASAPAQPAGS